MTDPLTALDAANQALQASPTVAKATRDYGAAATAAIHALAGTNPTPPPASSGLKVAYNATSGAQHASDWPAIHAQGFNTYICGADETAALAQLKATGCKAWITCGYWNGAGFSTTDAQATAMAATAYAAGVVAGIYVADEPAYSVVNASVISARAKLLKGTRTDVETLIAYYDPGTLGRWKGVVDAFALDAYPSRVNWNMSVITQLASAADTAGLRYYGVVGAFTDDSGNYPLPSPTQLQQMVTIWDATHQAGRAVYSWGATTKVVANQLQNQPKLLDVLRAANG